MSEQHCNLVACHERLARIETTLDNVQRAVCGNGQPGLVQRVMTMELRWAWVLGASAVMGALSGMLVPAIKAALK